jgi:hypothetical protein
MISLVYSQLTFKTFLINAPKFLDHGAGVGGPARSDSGALLPAGNEVL